MTGKLEVIEKEAEPTVHCNPNNCFGSLTEKYNPVTVHGLSSEVKIGYTATQYKQHTSSTEPHNIKRVPQPHSQTIYTAHLNHRATKYKKWYLNHAATQYKQGTSTIQPYNIKRVPQPYSH